MTDSPVTTNKPATVANSVLHAIVFDVAVKAAETEIIAAAPWLGLPIIKQIQTAIVNYVAGKIYDSMATGVTFAIIDAQTSAEAAAANKAADSLKQAVTSGDANAINQAKQDFSNAFGRLVHYDGSATP